MKNVIFTDKAPKPIGPYSQAIMAGGFIFVSGQLGIDNQANMPLTTKEQTKQVLENLKAILESTGSSLEKVVKVTIFFTQKEDFSLINEVYAEFFKNNPPARSAICVTALPKDALVEIEAIAEQAGSIYEH
ncbi:Endoribonuclease L-PSP [Desulfurella amilsii]|uniref:Endoribonuclease L-PSP n=1 Tax=Desulfurella amilsii TaxID=1562698 RepID=A0A1X4XVH5_9BACT|nr:Rid family detoxifying hydrolase [Desulfurella amilsii]OSS41546.1 Endoribonuclease L-PSP [Desulfurella amilsii]